MPCRARWAAWSPRGGNAIEIATAGVKVALRNLVIVPLVGGGGTSGIAGNNAVRNNGTNKFGTITVVAME